MFALRFDDFKRKLAALPNPVELHKLTTCYANTEEWDTYMGLYNMDNSVIELMIEDDFRAYTFYTIDPTKHTREALTK